MNEESMLRYSIAPKHTRACTTCTQTHTHTEMLFGQASMRACGICAPPHLLSQFPGRAPVLLGGGGVGGEAGGVEEDTKVGAKASVPHLPVRFLGSPGSVSPCDVTIRAPGRSFVSGPANKFALLSSGGNRQHLLRSVLHRTRVCLQTQKRPDSNTYRLSCCTGMKSCDCWP